MFQNKHQKVGVNAPEALNQSLSKPLLYVLAHGEASGDPGQINQSVFNGQTDVSIARGELELRKAIQSLAFITEASINSLPTLTALSLPGAAIPLFWTIHTFLQQQYEKPGLDNPINRRNHDARLLFKQLAQLDFSPWYAQSVIQVAPDHLPAEVHFPPEHPIPGQMYRHYPYSIKDKGHLYYPVNNYFSMLFEEREQELITLLSDLGATKIVIESVRSDATVADKEGDRKVFEYAPRPLTAPNAIKVKGYHWLAYEPTWQSVLNERFRGLTSIEFSFDMDVMGLLKTQIRSIDQLMVELDSIMPPANYKDILYQQVIPTRRVQVQFG
ncbi:hypothetical protein N836_22370 [Leptolyngbya sp. Heron Island J]|uniref:hypothetical protein n=1 Tax=Leptolyngbya sp. Heron Island J TaxID=1385935 RepID=UPI0003B9DF1A|nr:hypothetical protein [Leptolyngbya sp. Heron Island J]ESA33139.1 hypothetical protein N836_22370 [Leptolyngbya sp. Heron Island J]